MKYAIMSLDYKRYPLEYCFKLANRYGFDGLEIFGSRLHLYPDDLTSEKAKEILSFKKKYNIAVPMYTPNALNLPVCICSTLHKEREDGVKYYKKAIDVAESIEAGGVLVVADHPGHFYNRPQVWEYLVESLVEICDYSSGKGIQITIEPLTPLESPMITTSQDCLALINQVQHPNLFAMMDIVPAVIMHEPFSSYFHNLGEKLNYIHICNTDGITDAHLTLDHGILDITDVLTVINHQDYQGYLTTELYSESVNDPEMLAANTSRILRIHS